MANTYFTPDRKNSLFVPVEPTVLSQVVTCAAATAGLDFLVPVPWENCKVTHVESKVLSTLDTAADHTITLELDAAGGSTIATLTLTAGDAIGSRDTATVDATYGDNLSRSNGTRDAININAVGGAASMVQVDMYFEAEGSGA